MTSPDDSTRDLLRDTATRLFQDLCTPAALRDAETGAWPAALWRAVEDAGLPRALVPELAGGSGVNFTDAMVIVRAAGRFALPLPLPETMLAGWLLARAGLPVPDGPMTVAFGEHVTLNQNERGCYPRGPASRVPGRAKPPPSSRWTTRAGSPSRRATNARSSPARMSRGSLGTPWNSAAAPMRRATPASTGNNFVPWSGVPSPADRRRAGAGDGNDHSVCPRPHPVRPAIGKIPGGAAEPRGVGGADSGRRRRRRHGRRGGRRRCHPPAADRGGEGSVRGGRGIGAAIAHQVHGAIGFTHEHSLHFLTKRLWSWRDEFGNETVWNRFTGHHMAKAGPARSGLSSRTGLRLPVWAEITGPGLRLPSWV